MEIIDNAQCLETPWMTLEANDVPLSLLMTWADQISERFHEAVFVSLLVCFCLFVFLPPLLPSQSGKAFSGKAFNPSREFIYHDQ